MEHLSSIIEAVKERLRSPFIFSFLISWLIWNWPVTMAFVWFRSDKLNIVQLINDTATGWWSTLVPLISSIVWTFGVPFLSIGMRMFNAKIVKWSNDRVFKISEQSKVSFEHYFSVLHENTTKGKQLDEMIEKQTTLRDQRNAAMNRTAELETKITEKEGEINLLKTTHAAGVDEFNNKLRSSQENYFKKIAELKDELNKLKDIDETIYSVWKMTRYDDSIVYVEFTNFSPSKIEPSFLAKISPSVVYTYFVLDAIIHRGNLLVVASNIFPDNKPTDYFYLFSQNPNSNVWAGYENSDVIKSFERLPDSDFHVKIK